MAAPPSLDDDEDDVLDDEPVPLEPLLDDEPDGVLLLLAPGSELEPPQPTASALTSAATENITKNRFIESTSSWRSRFGPLLECRTHAANWWP